MPKASEGARLHGTQTKSKDDDTLQHCAEKHTNPDESEDQGSLSNDQRLKMKLSTEPAQLQELPQVSCVDASPDSATQTVLESQTQRYVSALKGLNASLIEISAPLPPFGRDSVVFKILEEGWLEILSYTLHTPITGELFLSAIVSFSTVLTVGNICGNYTTLPGFAKLIILCMSSLSQVPAVIRGFQHAAAAFGAPIAAESLHDVAQDLPPQLESCIRLLGVMSWIIEDFDSAAVREQWQSHLIQCGLVGHAMEIVQACDCVRLLDRATRSFTSVFRIHAAQQVVAQTPAFVHALMDKVVRMYGGGDTGATAHDCGGTVYLLMVVLHNDGVRGVFLDREVSQGHTCVTAILSALQGCTASRLALSSCSRLLHVVIRGRGDRGVLRRRDARDRCAATVNAILASENIMAVLTTVAVSLQDKPGAPHKPTLRLMYEMVSIIQTSEWVGEEIVNKDFLDVLSGVVAENMLLLEFMTTLHQTFGTEPSQNESLPAPPDTLAGEPLFWLLVALSQAHVVISRIAELFPAKDVPMAVYIIATFCATTRITQLDNEDHTTRVLSLDDSWEVSLNRSWQEKKEEWVRSMQPPVQPTLGHISARSLLGCCDQCHVIARVQGSLKTCSRCRAATYCSQECQRSAWKSHKKQCSSQSTHGKSNTEQHPLADGGVPEASLGH
eukprot:m.788927 g.788927  ORF g.788927 m.788927 type:complete len:671 (+) comp23320_c0_seq1:506-2518(+)